MVSAALTVANPTVSPTPSRVSVVVAGPNMVASTTAADTATAPARSRHRRAGWTLIEWGVRVIIMSVMSLTIPADIVSPLCEKHGATVRRTHRCYTGSGKPAQSVSHKGKGMTMANADTSNELRRPDGGPVRVLVVDDEPTLAELLSMALRYEGWEVRSAGDGQTAVRTARDFRPDAVVLDMMLPDIDGLEVLRRLRGEAPEVPVLFLTAKDSVEDRITGLTAGGDDYVTKPFSLEEVVARLRGLMRRMGHSPMRTESQLVVGDLSLDEDSHEVRRGGTLVTLTATEFELLRYLMRNPRRVLSKSQILDRVWNYDFGGQANVVELYISYLRKKIDAGRTPMIHTMRGAGYVLKPAD
jgi:two-component system OmpR family response regulator